MDICALSKIRYLVRARPEICTWLGGIMFAVDSSVSFGIKYDGAVSWHTFEREKDDIGSRIEYYRPP